jgi:2',3'-cyclic-nucleotide 2'-phosphodiesterase (5'-nucleotidase family)
MKFLLLMCTIIMCTPAIAKKIQIIHTNDLHTYFKGYTPDRGGYYRVKTLIDQLKASAKEEGIESIVLDAGDFGEGSHYFLADEGMNSFEALKLLGVDAAVIGNHDYMFGGKVLSDQIRKVNSKTQFLGANISPTENMRLKGLLKETARFEIDGMNIDIIGLTTNSLHFVYAFSPGLIFPVAPVSRAHSLMARENNSDLVVALTHLGVSKDQKLVQEDPNIDVVIGGHSHTRLEEAVYQENSEKRLIPIVQTGAHGMAVGSLILDLKGPKDVSVESYKLYDTDESVKSDPEVLSFVNDVDMRTKIELAEGRFDEVIGYSDFDLTGSNEFGLQDHQEGCWTGHLGNIVKEGANADVGLYLSSFAGKTIPKGPITYGNIIENFPHITKFGEKGWEVMKFDIKGWHLYSLMTAIVNLPIPGSLKPLIGGVQYRTYTFPKKIPYVGGRKFFTKFRINGKRIRFRRKYSLALPYELSRMLNGILSKKIAGYIPIDFKRNEYFLWDMAENYIKKRQHLKCI